MRAVATVMTAMFATLSQAPACATSAATLRDDVLQLTASLLEQSNLHVDATAARVVTSRELGADETFTLVPLWSAGDTPPPMPLTFELVGDGLVGPRPTVTLVASLARDALVLRHRRDRGARIGCDDVEVRRRPLRLVPRRAMPPPCALDGEVVLARTLAADDVLRLDDIGDLPDVPAQAPVHVRVVQGAVVLEHAGVAMADARLGERVKVRLNGSQRQVTGRVLAANMVVVEGGP